MSQLHLPFFCSKQPTSSSPGPISRAVHSLRHRLIYEVAQRNQSVYVAKIRSVYSRFGGNKGQLYRLNSLKIRPLGRCFRDAGCLSCPSHTEKAPPVLPAVPTQNHNVKRQQENHSCCL